jgi:hypothetical protein
VSAWVKCQRFVGDYFKMHGRCSRRVFARPINIWKSLLFHSPPVITFLHKLRYMNITCSPLFPQILWKRKVTNILFQSFKMSAKYVKGIFLEQFSKSKPWFLPMLSQDSHKRVFRVHLPRLLRSQSYSLPTIYIWTFKAQNHDLKPGNPNTSVKVFHSACRQSYPCAWCRRCRLHESGCCPAMRVAPDSLTRQRICVLIWCSCIYNCPVHGWSKGSIKELVIEAMSLLDTGCTKSFVYVVW